MKLWIVGKFIESTTDGRVWEFAGVFDDKIKAILHAINAKDKNHFVGPAELNNGLPEEKQDWKGSFYPQLLKLWYDKFPDGHYEMEEYQNKIAKQEKTDILKAYSIS